MYDGHINRHEHSTMSAVAWASKQSLIRRTRPSVCSCV